MAQPCPARCSILHRVVSIVVAIAAVWLFGVGEDAMAATHVSGTFSTSRTWTAASSPYVVDSTVTVGGASTLTIEPGVVVKFAGGNTATLAVNGTLNALGTASNRIVFTSL